MKSENSASKNSTKQNAVLSFLGNIAFALIGFVSILILARSLSVEEYGIWVIYLTSMSLVEMMRIGFVHSAIIRFIAGKEKKDTVAYIGSSWVLTLVLTLALTSILFLLSFFVQPSNSYYYFLVYYPLFAWINIPQILSLSLLQAQSKIKQQLFIKFFNMSLSLVVFIVSYIYSFDVVTIIQLHLAVTLLTTLVCLLNGWTGIENVLKFGKTELKELLSFGKFSIGTLIGTNLLKSADTFILAFALGSEQAALYSIPLKLTEVFEIILRSLINVAMPKLAEATNQNKLDVVKETFHKYAGLITWLYVPIMLICFVFAEDILYLLAGDSYTAMGNVFRVLTIYGLLLPLDRFTGVTLDCLNRPQQNMVKVLAMVSCNILLDILVVVFHLNLEFIALGTIVTTSLGILIGMTYLKSSFSASYTLVLKSGWTFWKTFEYK